MEDVDEIEFDVLDFVITTESWDAFFDELVLELVINDCLEGSFLFDDSDFVNVDPLIDRDSVFGSRLISVCVV